MPAARWLGRPSTRKATPTPSADASEALATLLGRVLCLRSLREEAVVRPQPEPLDGGDEAPVQPEPPARPRAARRQGEARVRLHPLPQGRQGAEGRLTHSE